jgi:small-conductance mechanosensitive channel
MVGAAYHHDPAEVIALLEATALQVPRVLPEPAPKGLLLSYGDSAINYALRFWIANPMDNVTICSEVNQAIWHAFKREGIEIPFPQQVQHQLPGSPGAPVLQPPPNHRS